MTNTILQRHRAVLPAIARLSYVTAVLAASAGTAYIIEIIYAVVLAASLLK